jgi:hypothetical protein
VRIRHTFTTLSVALALLAVVPAARADTTASAWGKPDLHSPITVVANASHSALALDTTKDYIVQLTPGADSIPGGLSIWGGHNVVIDGGHIDVPDHAGGLVLKNQTGTMWVHNLHISGAQLMEGIDLDERQPGATVVLQDILVDTVHGSYTTNHADLLQTWAGPSKLLIDGFTGSTDYQGFFLLPTQYMPGKPPELFDIRHVDIDDTAGGYALWRESGMSYPLNVQDVYVKPNPTKLSRDWWLWPKPSTGDTSWSQVSAGTPAGGSFVPGDTGALTSPPASAPAAPVDTTWANVVAGTPPGGSYVRPTRAGAAAAAPSHRPRSHRHRAHHRKRHHRARTKHRHARRHH